MEVNNKMRMVNIDPVHRTMIKSFKMNDNPLNRKTILITGAAKRLGRLFALACARAGADIIIHHGHSQEEALQVQDEIESVGQRAWILASDLGKPAEVTRLISRANEFGPLYALVNSAAVFESLLSSNNEE
jgi:NAD(P)-dependent dehydrogenase (short-subunit alcohol dehydrogenase family)